MIELRPYQVDSINESRNAFKKGIKKILLCVPTGGGKTTIASEMIKNAVANGKTVLFLAHREELIYQAHERLKKFGVKAGIIMGAKHKYEKDTVNVASIQTLINREKPPADLVFIDEAHHSSSASIVKILENYPTAYLIGLTATPERLDKKPLSHIYNELIEKISIKELISQGFLVPTKTFAAIDSLKKDDFKDVGKSMGDYNTKQLYEKYDKPKLYKGVVDNYIKICNGKKAIVFNVNCEHSRKTCEEFNARGIKAKHLDADVNEKERKQILNDFANGLFNVLCNVNILTEGYDLPTIEAVLLNRATQSTSLYFQMIGRGLRPSQNKEYCLVVDFGVNYQTHGFVTDERQWNWNGKKEKKLGASPIKECPDCNQILFLSAKICDNCGHIFTKKDKEKKELISEFVEIGNTIPTKNISEMSIEELENYRVQKGYQLGWLVRNIATNNKYDSEKIKSELLLYAKMKDYQNGWVYRQLKTLNLI